MQLAPDITQVQEGFSGFAQLGHSLDDKVKVAMAWAEVTKKVLRVFEGREIKLQEEPMAS